MKVYVLIDSWQFDSGDCGRTVKVFDTYEKAREEYKKHIFIANVDMANYDTKKTSEETDSYSIWEDGEYCYNHIDIEIATREVL